MSLRECFELWAEEHKFTELHLAVKENRVSDVLILVQNKTLINSQVKADGITSLLLSCFLPVDTIITKVLIDAGADVNLCDYENCSPLLAACKSRTEKVDIVKLLLQSGANINHQDNRGHTALHCCAQNKTQLQVVELLLQSGADTSLRNYYGMNPLMMAFHEENENCAEKILPFTEDLNVVSSYGWSAVMYAVQGVSSKDIIKKLVEQGANVNINVRGCMPVSLAALRYKDPTIFEYLWDLTSIDFLKEEDEMLLTGFQGVITRVLATDVWTTPTKIQYFYKILDTPGVDLNNINFIQVSVDHAPEFTFLLLPYCICNNPIDILQYIVDIKTMNIPILKLVKSILKLCTPSSKLRDDCIKFFKSCDLINYNLNAEDKVIWVDLYNEIIKLLSVDRLPKLQELSRNVVRKCLAPNCVSTEEYLNTLNMLQLPPKITNIIRCKIDVNP